MGLAIRAHFRARDGTLEGDRIIHQIPARFGRNAVNECVLAHPFVSEFHAVIELVNGQLCLRDLDSRNGVFDANMARLPAAQPVSLSSIANAFNLGRAVNVTVSTFDDRRAIGERASSVTGSVIGNRAALEAEIRGGRISEPPYAERTPGPQPPGGWSQALPSLPPLSVALDRSPGVGHAPPAYSPAQPGPFVSQSLPALQPLPGMSPAGAGAYSSPPAAYAQAGPNRIPVGPNTQHLAMSTETMALIGLRELAASLVPGARLETTGDIARLLTKVHDVIEAFCRSFVPLRDAGRRLPRGGARSTGSPTALRVERTNDPAGLAALLLDWRNQDYDGPEAVDGILTDLVMQQAILVENVMRGVGDLLAELSPEAIERTVKEDAGMGAVFGRYRALWNAYRERFNDLSSETRQLELVFGVDAATSYRQQNPRERG